MDSLFGWQMKSISLVYYRLFTFIKYYLFYQTITIHSTNRIHLEWEERRSNLAPMDPSYSVALY